MILLAQVKNGIMEHPGDTYHSGFDWKGASPQQSLHSNGRSFRPAFTQPPKKEPSFTLTDYNFLSHFKKFAPTEDSTGIDGFVVYRNELSHQKQVVLNPRFNPLDDQVHYPEIVINGQVAILANPEKHTLTFRTAIFNENNVRNSYKNKTQLEYKAVYLKVNFKNPLLSKLIVHPIVATPSGREIVHPSHSFAGSKAFKKEVTILIRKVREYQSFLRDDDSRREALNQLIQVLIELKKLNTNKSWLDLFR